MLQRRTKLTAQKRLNQISPRRVAELNAQKDTRIALCKRAGGKPMVEHHIFKINGKNYLAYLVTCVNGKCECGCGEFAPILEPHELKTRGSGGKLSMSNSIMVVRKHHPISKPQWTPRASTSPPNRQGKVLGNG